jgi:hypothetical protein
VKAATLFGETKSVIAEFSTDGLANALIIGGGRYGREPALVAAVIVSVPASAALHLPAVSLASSPDSKDSIESTTNPFKNVFDSLTLFEDLQSGSGAEQEGAPVPKSSAKKELPADVGSGTEDAVVPQMAGPNLAKASLILQMAALKMQLRDGAGPSENQAGLDQEAPQEAAALPLSSSQAAAVQPLAVASATPAAYAQYQVLSGTTRLEVATATLSAPAAAPTKAAGAVTPPTPAKQPAATITPSTNETASTLLSNLKPSAATSVSTSAKPLTPLTPEPVVAQPVQKGSTQEVAVPAPEAQTETALLAPSLPTTGSTLGVQSPGTLQARASTPTALSLPVNVPPPTAKTQPAMGTRLSAPIAQPATLVATVKPARALAPIPLPLTDLLSEQPVSTSAPLAQPATRSATEKLVPANLTAPQSSETAKAAPTIAKAPVHNNDPIEWSLPVDNSPQAAPPGPLIMEPAPQPTPSRGAAKAVPQPRVADPIAAPAQLRQPETPNAPPASATESNVPEATVSLVEKQPEPITPAEVTAPVMSSPAPQLPVHEVADRAAEPSGPSVVQHEALPVTPAPKTPLVPEAENFAFALRMLGLENSSSVTKSDTPITSDATPATPAKGPALQSQASSLQQQPPQTPSAPSETQSSAAPEPATKPDVGAPNQPDVIKAQPTPAIVPHWNDAAVAQAPEMPFLAGTSESNEAMARPNLPLAAQETHLMAPELPKSSTSSEILLHLTGNDESSAAIRVADRAGSVNVSVHTSDPVLRESLRSNLGELSTQLNAQGWKADVIKSAAVAAHPEGQQDSHTGGQRGSQQQSPGGERQPQRDRRANGGQWQQELDQQITGGDAYPGGNG